jgi:hypothetical protein
MLGRCKHWGIKAHSFEPEIHEGKNAATRTAPFQEFDSSGAGGVFSTHVCATIEDVSATGA